MTSVMRTCCRRASLYARMFRRWGDMLRGQSYWHAEQGLGRQFVPGQLLGYFNDLSAKASWTGPVDEDGLPLNRDIQGNSLYFPTTLLQKALGHWDRWLESGRRYEADRAAFLKLAGWALRAQDEHGGWPTWPLVGLKYSSPYSAMSQGEAASVLVRAYSLTQDERFAASARRALELMLTDVERGGASRRTPEGRVLEEAPLVPPNTLLNGWIFALYGLYDYLLLAQEDMTWAEVALRDSLQTLLAKLPQFDAGFWSYYDTSGNLASPFYQQLHIAQLNALEITFPEISAQIRPWRQVFEQQAASRLNRVKALFLKACQKLRRPPDVVLR